MNFQVIEIFSMGIKFKKMFEKKVAICWKLQFSSLASKSDSSCDPL